MLWICRIAKKKKNLINREVTKICRKYGAGYQLRGQKQNCLDESVNSVTCIGKLLELLILKDYKEKFRVKPSC